MARRKYTQSPFRLDFGLTTQPCKKKSLLQKLQKCEMTAVWQSFTHSIFWLMSSLFYFYSPNSPFTMPQWGSQSVLCRLNLRLNSYYPPAFEHKFKNRKLSLLTSDAQFVELPVLLIHSFSRYVVSQADGTEGNKAEVEGL